MARRWLFDGKADDSGRMCLEIDPENGTQPIRVWGRSREEILDKAAKTVEHGARTISQLRSQLDAPPQTAKKPNGTASPPASPPAHTNPTQLSPGEQLRFTAELSDPAKAPAAVTRLVQHETGIDFGEMHRQKVIERIATIEANWSANHPSFPKHPINYRLVNDAAALRVGYENITAEVLDDVYQELSSAGLLVAAEEETSLPTVLPEETPATRTVRLRGATSYRKSNLSTTATAVASTPKYSQEQIDRMSSAEYRRKLDNDPDFRASVDLLSSQPRPNA